MINIENSSAFRDPLDAARVVATKRDRAALEHAYAFSGCDVVVDAAYYNAVLATALLDHHPNMRLVGLIRDCESFVRSVTWLRGEDPMPVGWPAVDKELTQRERFIEMGRIRPADDDAAAEQWPTWGPIERNVWLWSATNHRLLDARDAHPDRTAIIDFAELRIDPVGFTRSICQHLRLDARPAGDATWADVVELARSRTNERQGGYQIGASASWSRLQQALLADATNEIAERLARGRN